MFVEGIFVFMRCRPEPMLSVSHLICRSKAGAYAFKIEHVSVNTEECLVDYNWGVQRAHLKGGSYKILEGGIGRPSNVVVIYTQISF